MASSSTATSSAPMGLGLGLGLGAMGGLGLLLPADRERDPEMEPCSPPRGVLRLRGAVQHYEWGSRADASLVARLAGERGESRPCAELWMGTHPSAPSSLAASDDSADGGEGEVSLREWLARNPAAVLGRAVTARCGGDLPFLFKVLSVAQPLSIQAHPDRELARALHALHPATYRDANHKPEMALAESDLSPDLGVLWKLPALPVFSFAGVPALLGYLGEAAGVERVPAWTPLVYSVASFLLGSLLVADASVSDEEREDLGNRGAGDLAFLESEEVLRRMTWRVPAAALAATAAGEAVLRAAGVAVGVHDLQPPVWVAFLLVR